MDLPLTENVVISGELLFEGDEQDLEQSEAWLAIRSLDKSKILACVAGDVIEEDGEHKRIDWTLDLSGLDEQHAEMNAWWKVNGDDQPSGSGHVTVKLYRPLPAQAGCDNG